MASFKKLSTGWQYRISYKENGKYRTKNGNGFATKKEAQIAAAEIENNLLKGFKINGGERLFHDYFNTWFEIYRKGKHSKDTDGYIRRAVEFAKQSFPDTKLKELTRDNYQEALNKFGETHATASVRKHHIYMKACIQDAIQDGIIYKDPTYRVKAVGKKDAKSEELKYLNYTESVRLIKELITGIKPEYMSRYMILFGLATGCRFSEIAGLTWDCVDFQNKTVRIIKTWDYRYTNDFSNTKNYQSKRIITVDDDTIKYLRQLELNQKKNKLRTGIENQKQLVFLNDDLEINSNSAVNKTLKKFCRKIGCTEITCHGLRHTHASILIYQGVNIKYVSRRLGHGDIGTTLGTYHHILDELEQKESNIVSKLLAEMYH